MTGSGIVTKTTLDNATTAKITSMVSSITSQVRRLSIIPLASRLSPHEKLKMFPKAKSVVRDLDPINDLRFLRMRSNKTEILIAPGE